jgi:hypothetical protein
VYEYLDDSPKDVKKVVEAMEQKTRKRVRTKTIKRFIKKSGSFHETAKVMNSLHGSTAGITR